MNRDVKDGAGLGAFVLSINLLFLLTQKGTISETEAREIVDLGLLNLEEQERTASSSMQGAVRAARSLLIEIANSL
ncbi:hypothetical protein [Parvibaculum sp.]|uniref:hypothetical protein n=1 Tax=Parvibaculum sp. TaxID=2024848 RepID=UPI00329778D9